MGDRRGGLCAEIDQLTLLAGHPAMVPWGNFLHFPVMKLTNLIDQAAIFWWY